MSIAIRTDPMFQGIPHDLAVLYTLTTQRFNPIQSASSPPETGGVRLLLGKEHVGPFRQNSFRKSRGHP